MRSIILLLAACFLAVGLCGCQCGPEAQLAIRNPLAIQHYAPGTPVRAVPAYQGATWTAPAVQAPAYTAPAANPCR